MDKKKKTLKDTLTEVADLIIDIQRSSTKNKLCEAAISIILTQGSSSLTLDATAEAAGVSKGGLLHHYRNKDALIAGVVAWSIQNFNEDLQKEIANVKTSEWLQTYLRVFLKDTHCNNFAAALFVAAAENPKLLEPLFLHWALLKERAIAVGAAPAAIELVFFALKGLLVSEFTVLKNNDDKTELMNRLLQMTESIY